MMFLLVLLTFIPFLTSAQNCSSDQQNSIKTCYLSYLKTYGFSIIPVYNLYDGAQDKYRNQGWNGELYMCMAGKQLFDCIGDGNDECVNVDVFTNISGLYNDDVLMYIVDYRQMKYRCLGTGFTEFKDTYKCLQQMTDCPGNPLTCYQMIPYIKCMENMAYGFCGAEGRDFVCNFLEVTTKVYLTCDSLPKCSRNQTQI